jgi:hypothetical protein
MTIIIDLSLSRRNQQSFTGLYGVISQEATIFIVKQGKLKMPHLIYPTFRG